MFTKCFLLYSAITLLFAMQAHQFDGRIVGGWDVSIDEVPYQISLLKDGHHICGGSILSESIIVTAAHCLDGIKVNELSVRAGSSTVCSGGTVSNVAKYRVHENYQCSDVDYDVAVLLLEEPLTLRHSSKINSIKMSNKTPEHNTDVNVTGWGNLGELLGGSETLQIVHLKIVELSACKKAYNNTKLIISKNMICAGLKSPIGDSCYGDSGGPLVSHGKLVGIVSFGKECGVPEYPGVYTNVAMLREWIISSAQKLLQHI